VHEGAIVLLHGFIKKTRKTPTEDRALALQRKMRTSKPVKTRNKHRGSSFREFLREDGMLEEVQAVALKRAVALKVYDLMKKKKLSKSALAAEMRTSRAAIHRLLDPQNTSVTLATLNRAARSLGQKVKIELVAA
jgi:DNA-binding Xre family transcriptional regulator